MSIKVSQVRSAIAAKVEALPGFKELPFPGEYLGRVQNSIAHKGFAVSVETSLAAEDRQARRSPYYLNTAIRVKFAYRLRPHSVIDDYGLAMDSEQDVLVAVLGNYVASRPGLQVRYTRSLRNFTDSLEYIIIELELNALHHIN